MSNAFPPPASPVFSSADLVAIQRWSPSSPDLQEAQATFLGVFFFPEDPQEALRWLEVGRSAVVDLFAGFGGVQEVLAPPASLAVGLRRWLVEEDLESGLPFLRSACEGPSPPPYALRSLELALAASRRWEELVSLVGQRHFLGCAAPEDRGLLAALRLDQGRSALEARLQRLQDPLAFFILLDQGPGTPSRISELCRGVRPGAWTPGVRALLEEIEHDVATLEETEAWPWVEGTAHWRARCDDPRWLSARRLALWILHGLPREAQVQEEARGPMGLYGGWFAEICAHEAAATTDRQWLMALHGGLLGAVLGWTDAVGIPPLLRLAMTLGTEAWTEALADVALSLPQPAQGAACLTVAAAHTARDNVARSWLDRALAVVPDLLPARILQARLAARHGRFRDLVVAAPQVAAALDDPEPLLLDAARAASALGEVEAFTALRRRAAPGQEPSEEEVLELLASSRMLMADDERLLEAEAVFMQWLRRLSGDERRGKLALLVDRLDGRARALVRRELARLDLQVGDPDTALQRLRNCTIEPSPDRGALRVLSRAAATLGDHQTAALALECLARHVEDPTERARLYLEVAHLHRDRLGGGPVVLEDAMLAFTCDGDDADSLALLETLCLDQQRWTEVLGVYDVALVRAGLGPVKVPLFRKRALVLARHLDQPEGAADARWQALLLDPEDGQAADSLQTLCAVLSDDERWMRLLRLRARHAPPDRWLDHMVRVGRAQLELGTDHDALEELWSVFCAGHDYPGVAELMIEVLTRTEQWFWLGALHVGVALRSLNPMAQRRAWEAAATALGEQAKQPAAAVLVLDLARERLPGDAQLLRLQIQFLESDQQWSRLWELCDEETRFAAEPTDRARIWFRLGCVLETAATDAAGAQRAFERALAEDRRCVPALHGLRELFIAQLRWTEALETLHAELTMWQDPAHHAELYGRIAEIQRLHCFDPSAARSAATEALKKVPGYAPALRLLGELAMDEQRWDDARGYALQVDPLRETREGKWAADLLAELDAKP